jgi:NAD(P)-dependent dehydrogenase (short-subunit alcohol dehydrogenase family)
VKRTDELLDLSGKVALVTGGSRGIGRAVAEALAGAGADVVVASRKLDNCETAAREITAATGRRALPVACHVGKWEECDRLVETVYGEFGRCDVLVNNAGMSPAYDGLASVGEALYDKVHATNARGPFRLSVLTGERMAQGDGGSIINISSIGSQRPNTIDLPYDRDRYEQGLARRDEGTGRRVQPDAASGPPRGRRRRLRLPGQRRGELRQRGAARGRRGALPQPVTAATAARAAHDLCSQAVVR